MATDTPTTDLVIIDAEIVEDDRTFGNQIVNTVATTAATSAVIVGGLLAYKFLKPRVASLFHRSKSEEPEVLVVDSTIVETPETEKV